MAHAIERASDYAVRHGEAVAIGSVYVAELARLAGVLDDATADRHRAAFERVGLPTRWHGATYDELRAAMAVDKKARGSRLRFVVLEGVAVPQVLADPDEALLRAAYDLMVGGDEGVVMKVLVLNGPNLGRLGRREPDVYGHTSYNELVELCVDWGRELGLRGRGPPDQPRGRPPRLAERRRRRGHARRPERRRLDALLVRALRRVRPAERAARRGAPQRPLAAAGGVPAHLGGHSARQGGGRRQGRRRLPGGSPVPLKWAAAHSHDFRRQILTLWRRPTT